MGAPDFFDVAAREEHGELVSSVDFPAGTVIHSSMAVMYPHNAADGTWWIHANIGADPMFWVRLVGGPWETQDECANAIRALADLPTVDPAADAAETADDAETAGRHAADG